MRSMRSLLGTALPDSSDAVSAPRPHAVVGQRRFIGRPPRYTARNRASTMRSNHLAGFSSSFFPRPFPLPRAARSGGSFLFGAAAGHGAYLPPMGHAKSAPPTFASLVRAVLELGRSRLERAARDMRGFDVGAMQNRPDERIEMGRRRGGGGRGGRGGGGGPGGGGGARG